MSKRARMGAHDGAWPHAGDRAGQPCSLCKWEVDYLGWLDGDRATPPPVRSVRS